MITEDQYKEGLAQIHIVTNVTKYRDFQYRLMMNAIYANNILYHWKKVDSQRCEYCDCPKQNIKHLLYECIYSIKIWRDFKNFVCNKMHLNEEFVLPHSAILHIGLAFPRGHVLNFFILIIKQHIFASKCLGTRPTFKEIENKFKAVHRIEKFIAHKNEKLYKHEKKWSPYTGYNPKENIEHIIEKYVNEEM